jgi:hypothetical protein
LVFESLCPFCESRASFTAYVRRGRLTQAWSIRCASCGGQLPALTELELRHARGMDPAERTRISAALRDLERPVLLGFEELRLLADGGRHENARRHARRTGRSAASRTGESQPGA